MPNMHCRARTARLERISTIQGVRTVEVVDTCDCSTGHPCRRDPYSQTLHVGTPYQVEIDVGACVGSCKSTSQNSSSYFQDSKHRSKDHSNWLRIHEQFSRIFQEIAASHRGIIPSAFEDQMVQHILFLIFSFLEEMYRGTSNWHACILHCR